MAIHAQLVIGRLQTRTFRCLFRKGLGMASAAGWRVLAGRRLMMASLTKGQFVLVEGIGQGITRNVLLKFGGNLGMGQGHRAVLIRDFIDDDFLRHVFDHLLDRNLNWLPGYLLCQLGYEILRDLHRQGEGPQLLGMKA